jgi:hypothetical protein
VAWSHPDGTVRLSATTATGTWKVTFSPGTPQQVIDAACGAALASANPPPATT